MQILTILRNRKFTYKRNSREYICVFMKRRYIILLVLRKNILEAVYEAAVKLKQRKTIRSCVMITRMKHRRSLTSILLIKS